MYRSKKDHDKFIKRINRAVAYADIKDILSTLGVNYRQRSYGDLWFRCVVRNHRKDSKASAHITHFPGHPNHGKWHCFGCDTSGNIVTLVQQVRDTRFKEALMMVEQHQLEHIEEVVKPFYNSSHQLPKFYESPPLEQDWKEEYLSYLYKRRITWKQICDHRIGYVDAGKYVSRVIVPITMNGQLQTWVGRHITSNADDRITSAPNGEVGLFGSELSNPYQEPAIVCEGWADALAVERLGYRNCMAAQTNKIHPEQFEVLKLFPYTIVIPDGDEAGDRFVDSLAPWIQDYKFLIVKITRGKDPDSCESEELYDCIVRAIDWEPIEDEYEVEIIY